MDINELKRQKIEEDYGTKEQYKKVKEDQARRIDEFQDKLYNDGANSDKTEEGRKRALFVLNGGLDYVNVSANKEESFNLSYKENEEIKEGEVYESHVKAHRLEDSKHILDYYRQGEELKTKKAELREIENMHFWQLSKYGKKKAKKKEIKNVTKMKKLALRSFQEGSIRMVEKFSNFYTEKDRSTEEIIDNFNDTMDKVYARKSRPLDEPVKGEEHLELGKLLASDKEEKKDDPAENECRVLMNKFSEVLSYKEKDLTPDIIEGFIDELKTGGLVTEDELKGTHELFNLKNFRDSFMYRPKIARLMLISGYANVLRNRIDKNENIKVNDKQFGLLDGYARFARMSYNALIVKDESFLSREEQEGNAEAKRVHDARADEILSKIDMKTEAPLVAKYDSEMVREYLGRQIFDKNSNADTVRALLQTLNNKLVLRDKKLQIFAMERSLGMPKLQREILKELRKDPVIFDDEQWKHVIQSEVKLTEDKKKKLEVTQEMVLEKSESLKIAYIYDKIQKGTHDFIIKNDKLHENIQLYRSRQQELEEKYPLINLKQLFARTDVQKGIMGTEREFIALSNDLDEAYEANYKAAKEIIDKSEQKDIVKESIMKGLQSRLGSRMLDESSKHIGEEAMYELLKARKHFEQMNDFEGHIQKALDAKKIPAEYRNRVIASYYRLYLVHKNIESGIDKLANFVFGDPFIVDIGKFVQEKYNNIVTNNAKFDELTKNLELDLDQWRNLKEFLAENEGYEGKTFESELKRNIDYHQQLLKEKNMVYGYASHFLKMQEGFENLGEKGGEKEKELKNRSMKSLSSQKQTYSSKDAKTLLDKAQKTEEDTTKRSEISICDELVDSIEYLSNDGSTGYPLSDYRARIQNTLEELLKDKSLYGKYPEELDFLKNVNSLEDLNRITILESKALKEKIQGNIMPVIAEVSRLTAKQSAKVMKNLMRDMMLGNVQSETFEKKISGIEDSMDETMRVLESRLEITMKDIPEEPGVIRYNYMNLTAKGKGKGKKFFPKERRKRFAVASSVWRSLRSYDTEENKMNESPEMSPETILREVLMAAAQLFENRYEKKGDKYRDVTVKKEKLKKAKDYEEAYQKYIEELGKELMADDVTKKKNLTKYASEERLKKLSEALKKWNSTNTSKLNLSEIMNELMFCETEDLLLSAGQAGEDVFATEGTEALYHEKLHEYSHFGRERLARSLQLAEVMASTEKNPIRKASEKRKYMLLTRKAALGIKDPTEEAYEIKLTSLGEFANMEELTRNFVNLTGQNFDGALAGMKEKMDQIKENYQQGYNGGVVTKIQNELIIPAGLINYMKPIMSGKESNPELVDAFREYRTNFEKAKTELSKTYSKSLASYESVRLENISKYGFADESSMMRMLTVWKSKQDNDNGLDASNEIYRRNLSRVPENMKKFIPILSDNMEYWNHMTQDADASDYIKRIYESTFESLDKAIKSFGSGNYYLIDIFIKENAARILGKVNKQRTEDEWFDDLKKFDNDFNSKCINKKNIESRVGDVAKKNPEALVDVQNAFSYGGASIEVLFEDDSFKEMVKKCAGNKEANRKIFDQNEEIRALKSVYLNDDKSLNEYDLLLEYIKPKLAIDSPKVFKEKLRDYLHEYRQKQYKQMTTVDAPMVKADVSARLEVAAGIELMKNKGREKFARHNKIMEETEKLAMNSVPPILSSLREYKKSMGEKVKGKEPTNENIAKSRMAVEKALGDPEFNELSKEKKSLIQLLGEEVNIEQNYKSEDLKTFIKKMSALYDNARNLFFFSGAKDRKTAIYKFISFTVTMHPELVTANGPEYSFDELKEVRKQYDERNNSVARIDGLEFDKEIKLEDPVLAAELKRYVKVLTRYAFTEKDENAFAEESRLMEGYFLTMNLVLKLVSDELGRLWSKTHNGEKITPANERAIKKEFMTYMMGHRYFTGSREAMNVDALKTTVMARLSDKNFLDAIVHGTRLNTINKDTLDFEKAAKDDATPAEFDEFIRVRVSKKVFGRYNELTESGKKVVALAMNLPEGFKPSASLLSSFLLEDEHKDVLNDSVVNDIALILQGKDPVSIVAYKPAMARLVGMKGEFAGKVFEDALEFALNCEKTWINAGRNNWDVLNDPYLSIEQANLMEKGVMRKGGIPQNIKNVGDFRDTLLSYDVDKKCASEIKALNEVELRRLITVLQNRSVLDTSVKDGSELNPVMKKNVAVSMLKDSRFTNDAENTLYIDKAMASIFSYQVRDDLEEGKIPRYKDDFVKSSIERKTLVDNELLAKALEFIKNVKAAEDDVESSAEKKYADHFEKKKAKANTNPVKKDDTFMDLQKVMTAKYKEYCGDERYKFEIFNNKEVEEKRIAELNMRKKAMDIRNNLYSDFIRQLDETFGKTPIVVNRYDKFKFD